MVTRTVIYIILNVFIHQTYLQNVYHVTGAILVAWDASVSKSIKTPVLVNLTLSAGDIR